MEFGSHLKESEFFLKSDAVYLNAGSYGTVPKRVFHYQMRLKEQIEAHPDDWHRRGNPRQWRQSLQAVCEFIGSRLQDTVLVENATTGLDSVMTSVKLTTGDAILLTNWTYNTVKVTSRRLTENNSGAEVLQLDLSFPILSKEDILGKYKAMLKTHTGIKLAIIDHITSPTAVVMPVKEISELCHRHNVMVLVDGAHSWGQIPLDIESLGVDFYAGNIHKWGFVPRGCGYLWISPQYHDVIRPTVTSHFHGVKLHYDFCVRGTRDDTSYHCVPEGIRFLNDLGGLEAVITHVSGVLEAGVARLETAWGTKRLEVNSELTTPFMRLIRVPELQGYPATAAGAGDLETDLYEKYNIQLLCMAVQGKLYFRLSAHVYTSMEDFDKLEKAVFDLKANPLGRERVKSYDIPIMHWDLSPLNF